MGHFASTLFEKESHQIVMIGLDEAGKSSLLGCLKKSAQSVDQGPTVGFNSEKFECKNAKGKTQLCTYWDVGGQERLRALWKVPQMYIRRTDAVIFVVDSADDDRLPECKKELVQLFKDGTVPPKIPFIILLNKIDLPRSRPQEYCIEQMGLKDINYDFTIVKGCALTGMGLTEFVTKLNDMINESRKRNKK